MRCVGGACELTRRPSIAIFEVSEHFSRDIRRVASHPMTEFIDKTVCNDAGRVQFSKFKSAVVVNQFPAFRNANYSQISTAPALAACELSSRLKYF